MLVGDYASQHTIVISKTCLMTLDRRNDKIYLKYQLVQCSGFIL